MDKRRSILNVAASIISRIVLLAAALVIRRLLIRYIGNEVNGLNSLYTDMIGMLAVAELGIGSAISYSMYRPIVEGNTKQVAALYCLYKRLYLIIGAVILAAGIGAMPFLPALISDYGKLTVNVYGTFLLALAAVVLTYFYSAKTALIDVYKDNYITTGIMTVSRLTGYGLQAAAILIWKSFYVFLACKIAATLLAWFLTELVARRKHGDIMDKLETADEETKAEITRNVKAMAMHKAGTALVKTADSLIISGFIGVVVLGKYSNYTYIAGVLAGIISLFFSPLTSVIGHLCAAGNLEETKKVFDRFYCLNYILGMVFFLGYFAVIDCTVALLFGPGLGMSRTVAFVIALNQFTQYMRNTLLLFRNASGTFYQDRWKPVAEGAVNLVLSLFLVSVFPEEYQVAGVIAATILTTLLICYTVEPHVVYRHVFGKPAKAFIIRNYAYTGLFVVCLVVLDSIIRAADGAGAEILLNGTISVALAAAALGSLAIVDSKFREETKLLAGETAAWVHRAFRKRER